MLRCRSTKANHGSSARRAVKSFFAFTLASFCYFCLTGIPAVAQGNPSSPDTHATSQSTHSVADRLAAQNALFKEQFEADMRASPENETARGDYRDNALLDDYSLAASVK